MSDTSRGKDVEEKNALIALTDDTLIVTDNVVSGQLCRRTAKFGAEWESYKSPPDMLLPSDT